MIDSFSEENKPFTPFYISNEVDYPAAAAQLAASKNYGGVYVGVGPEQNFTYIANVRPGMAFVIDIRRENVLEHLMYKAVFELSPTRSAFVSRLFSRVERPVGPEAKAEELFLAPGNVDSGLSGKTSEEIRNQLTKVHGYPLSTADLDAIDRMHSWLAGNMAWYGMLMASVDEKGRQWSYLASGENYQTVRNLQLRNLIVPVTGDFGGTKALRSIAEYLNSLNMKTSVFYASNVEGSLPGPKWQQFYSNLSLLPFDANSAILRAIPSPEGRHFFLFPTICPAQHLLQGFKDNTRQSFDPAC
jgi:hypothetical protein